MTDDRVPPPLPGAGEPPPPPLPWQEATPPPLTRQEPTPPPLPDPGPLDDPDPLGDPGPLDDPGVLHVTEDTRTFPCPKCGGLLIFDPGRQHLICPSCGSADTEFIVPDGGVVKRPLATVMRELADLRTEQETTGRVPLDKEIVCQSCGGHTSFAGTLTAIRCPYCTTPIQRTDLQDAPLRVGVDGILPLAVDEKRAREVIEHWINGRRFAPNNFKKYRELGSFTSIYLSYFSYDIDSTTHYTGRRGEDYTVTVGSGDNRRTETRTNWYPASGALRRQFGDKLGLANTGVDRERVQELEPWPIDQAVPYTPAFMAGHLSRTYDADPDQVWTTHAKPEVEQVLSGMVQADIGGDRQQVQSMNVDWHRLDFAQLLLPTWLLTVTYKNAPFQVFVNGQTGEVQGERPWSVIKITFAVLVVALVVGAIIWYVYAN